MSTSPGLAVRDEVPARPAAASARPGGGALRVVALAKSTGGIAQYNRALAVGLASAGVECHTLCLSENGEAYAASLRAAGVSAETMAMDRYRIDIGGDMRLFRRVVAVLRERRPDVVIGHGSKAGVLARAAGRVAGVPAVYCQHSMAFIARTQGGKAPVYWALEFGARLFGGHVVTLTETAAAATRRLGLASASALSPIYTGIDVERFRDHGRRAETLRMAGLDPERPVIGWIGRFETQKSPLDFAEAFAALARRRPEAQALVAGEGALREAFAERLRAAGAAERVAILPWQADPVRLYEAMDVYALTSLWEGLPLSLLEAMACGAAPVATAVDGSAEAIEDGVSGLLAPPGRPAEIAAALERLLADPALRARISAGARARVETRFASARWIADWRATLDRVVAGRPARSAGGD